MKKALNAFRIIYYIMGIIGMAICVPFYLGFYTNKKRS